MGLGKVPLGKVGLGKVPLGKAGLGKVPLGNMFSELQFEFLT